MNPLSDSKTLRIACLRVKADRVHVFHALLSLPARMLHALLSLPARVLHALLSRVCSVPHLPHWRPECRTSHSGQMAALPCRTSSCLACPTHMPYGWANCIRPTTSRCMPQPCTCTHQHAPARTSTHQHAPACTSTHQQAPARTSTHQHAPARTSTHQHAPARTSMHQHAPACTSMHQHAPACTSTHHDDTSLSV